jgi:hypothetical protein
MLNSTESTASGYFHLCKVWMSIVGGRPLSGRVSDGGQARAVDPV